MKKVLCVLISVILVLSCSSVAFAGGDKAELYTFYGDGMLFQQNKEAILSGTAENGSLISASLYKNDVLVTQNSAKAENGEFFVSFDAPEGSYDRYSISLRCNNTEFAVLGDVVFGELWLASGQSNMQYSLAQEKTGASMFANGEKLGDWLRVLLVPPVTQYNGSYERVPATPQNDIPEAKWVNGNSGAVYEISAVAYYFAQKLHEELDVPVGVLNASLGGSCIASWISRDAIDGNPEVKNILTSCGEYYPLDSWNETERSMFYDMTANFNLKINALGNFRPAGMIWYQGESDIILQKTPEQYGALFDLMQKSFSEHFGCDDGLLPIIFTQLASYQYHKENGIDLLEMNAFFTDIQKAQPESRGLVSLYDVPLTYLPELGPIHPDTKKDVGERMALCAKGLVYGGDGEYTPASVKDYEIKDGRICVTLENVGDGLVADGQLRGFAVAGADGIFVGAKAEIVNSNTVCVYSEKVQTPVSASYAYCLGNMNANLYASEGFPVSPFVVGKQENAHYWAEKQWADCESDTAFHLYADEASTKFYSTWESVNANIAFSGANGMNVTADGEFAVSPVMTGKNGLSVVRFNDECYDYSDYGTITFRVKNNGQNDVVFDGVKVYKSADVWYSTAGESVVIPADGEWHTVEADIDHMYLYGVDFGVKFANDKLKNIYDIDFCFTGKDAEISVDDFVFSPEKAERDTRFDITKLFNIFNIVKMFILELIRQ